MLGVEEWLELGKMYSWCHWRSEAVGRKSASPTWQPLRIRERPGCNPNRPGATFLEEPTHQPTGATPHKPKCVARPIKERDRFGTKHLPIETKRDRSEWYRDRSRQIETERDRLKQIETPALTRTACRPGGRQPKPPVEEHKGVERSCCLERSSPFF